MDLIPVKIDKISYHSASHSYAVLLRELTGDRVLPVIVGAFEAQAIALAVEQVKIPRPMTHDLLASIIDEAGGSLQSVVVTELRDSVYYACLNYLTVDGRELTIDARPSDAIAVALRMHTSILVSSEVMDASGVAESAIEERVVEREKSAEPSRKDLEEELNVAVEKEEYEIAARLRDQIKAME